MLLLTPTAINPPLFSPFIHKLQYHVRQQKTTQAQAATISRINSQGLEAQRKLLLDHLQAGNTINFMQAMDLGITHLNTRVAELRSQDITIYSRPMAYRNIKCQECSLPPFINQ